MRLFIEFVIKETKHILRDKRTMLILFGMPVVMMSLFGFAISTDIRNVRVAVVTTTMDDQSRQMVERLNASEYFTVTQRCRTTEEAKALVRNQEADMAVAFGPRFGDHRHDGEAQVLILADGVDPNTTSTQAAYAQSIINSDLQGTSSTVNTRLLYNPQMKSAYNFVPGIMGMLLLIICAMMTSVSVVREKERGSMEVLLVSPVRPLMVMVTKAVPYMVLSVVILVCILLLSRYMLGVPIRGSLALLALLSMLYILLSLSLGLLISVAARTQLVALLMSGMMLLMPSLFLSGMIYPVESMPVVLQWVSAVVPARWFISAVRKVMIMGVGFAEVAQETLLLAAMTAVLLFLALKEFRVRLDG
jgi:ABC-2 type transport system permease protein